MLRPRENVERCRGEGPRQGRRRSTSWAKSSSKGNWPTARNCLRRAVSRLAKTANFEQIRAGVEEIRKALRRKGYIEAKTSSDRKLNDEKKTLELDRQRRSGPAVHHGQAHDRGSGRRNGAPHSQALGVETGQPFNVEYPDYFLARLVADQIMDNLGKTRSAIAPNPETQDRGRHTQVGRSKEEPEQNEAVPKPSRVASSAHANLV